MKKILLGTTTLIGAAALFAGAASAETPKVTIGGHADFEVGIVNDDQDSDQRNHAFRSDTEVTFRVDGKTDSGLGYGGGVDLEADTGEADPHAATDARNQGLNASRTFVYLDGMWGRTEMGSEVGASGTMKVDASTIARASGGIAGDWWYFANASDQFWAMPDLDLGYDLRGASGTGFLGDAGTENLNKITYYTPRFSGFQLGISYMPDQIGRGQNIDRSDDNEGLSENIWAGGISYDNKFGDIGFAIAATGEAGSAQNTDYEDLRAWNVGAKLTYMGFSIAGSYGDLGESNRLTADNADNTHYWTLGGAYEMGPFGASLTYLDSEFDCGDNVDGLCSTTGHNDFRNISLGVDYKLAPGFTPFAEISWYEEDSADNAEDNDGTVGLIGTQLNF
jgi:outer membrane protein OmpU